MYCSEKRHKKSIATHVIFWTPMIFIVGCFGFALQNYVSLNLSKSMPRGLWIETKRMYTTQPLWVLVDPPDMALEKKCLSRNQHLLKEVFAIEGDVVCQKNNDIVLKGHEYHRIHTSTHDRHGLPIVLGLKGCHKVEKDHVFLVGQHPSSCDSRYFGTVHQNKIVQKVRPLLIWDDITPMRPKNAKKVVLP